MREGGVEQVLVALIWLLVYAAVIALACFIVARIVVTFLPAARGWAWIVWCIGGLVLLILAIRMLSGVVPAPP